MFQFPQSQMVGTLHYLCVLPQVCGTWMPSKPLCMSLFLNKDFYINWLSCVVNLEAEIIVVLWDSYN